MDDWIAGTVGTLLLVGTFGLGYSIASVTIRNDMMNDCKKLGAFYVGNTVYECKVKEKNT